MTPSLSISNILQALYEESPTVKMYVDCIASGQPTPYTLITKSTEHEKNEKIVSRLKESRDNAICDDHRQIFNEILDEAMILEEENYKIIMFKGEDVVEGSRQIVKGDKVVNLKEYAQYKGYEFSVRKLEK